MLRKQAKVFKTLNITVDIIITGLSLLLAIYLVYIINNALDKHASFNVYNLTLLFLIIPIWLLTFQYAGLYSSNREKGPLQICFWVIESIILSGIILSAFIFLLKISVKRNLIIYFLVINILLLIIHRMTVKHVLQAIRRKGYNYRNFLIVGTGKRAQAFTKIISEHSEWGFRIIGFVDNDESLVGKEMNGIKVLGTFREFSKILSDHLVDEVIFIVPRRWIDSLEDAIMVCEEIGIKTRIAADLFVNRIAKVGFDEMERWPLLTFDPVPYNLYAMLVKRVFDICFSLVFLTLALPFWLAIIIAIKISSPGHIFFKQVRVGLSGRQFSMLKFRTMVANAEEMRNDLEGLNEQSGPVFKIKNDPRLTRVGKFLRRLSLDELPQLINVLKGEMSIVGPRPPIPFEVERYDRWQRRRLSVRPGITCIWQIQGRNKIDFASWVKLDLQYIDNWSLGLDLKIIFKTLNAVLRATGQ